MKSIDEMQELVSLIAQGENAEAGNKNYVEGVVYELGGSRGDRSVQIEDYVIAATDCSDYYWDKLTAIKIESEEDLNHFIEATEEWLKLIQAANFFVGNKGKPQYVIVKQVEILIAKLEMGVELFEKFTCRAGSERNDYLRNLNKVLFVAAYYFMPNDDKWIIVACELASSYRFLYENTSKNSADLVKALKYAELALAECQNQNVAEKHLIFLYSTLGSIYKCKWVSNRTIENLNAAINYFEKPVIAKRKLQQLDPNDSDIHMLISLSVTLAEDDKQSFGEKLKHYNKALEYANLINDNRKLCHLYESVAEYYEKNYYVENGVEFVILENNKKSERSIVLKNLYWKSATNLNVYIKKCKLYDEKIPLPNKEDKISELKVFIRHYNIIVNALKLSKKNNHRYSHWNKIPEESGDKEMKSEKRELELKGVHEISKKSRH